MIAYWFSNKNDVKLLICVTSWYVILYTYNKAQIIKFSIKDF